jgi:hypothetical protein
VRGSQTAVHLGSSRELHTLLQQLTTFESIGHRGVDCGANVRIRSAAVLELLHDSQLLQQRRAAAADRLRTLSPTGLLQQQQQQQYGQYIGSSSSGYAAGGPDPFVAVTSVASNGYNSSYNSCYDNGYAGSSLLAPQQRQQQQQQAAAGSGSSALLVAGNSSSNSSSANASALSGVGLAVGGFGEAKGVSFEENKLRVVELRQLLAKPENR